MRSPWARSRRAIIGDPETMRAKCKVEGVKVDALNLRGWYEIMRLSLVKWVDVRRGKGTKAAVKL